jgi:hypothetical protein
MLFTGETEDQHMDNESNPVVTEDSAAPEAATAPVVVKAAPASLPHRLDEVVTQVRAQLITGQERRWGSNPYDSQFGRPSHDVWGIRNRA